MYDVIVVGAGPAGSTAAKVLADKGLHILLVERHKLPRYKSCSGVLIQKTIEKRLAELSRLTQAIYEDKVMGRIPEAVCVQLMNRYEAERADKLEQRAHLSGELEAYQQETDDVQQWMKLIREYAKLEELDRPTLLRLIKRIEVGEKKVEDGCTVRDIKIHYNFVGYIEA